MRSITMRPNANVNGGTTLGMLTAGNTYTVDSALAHELVNRQVADFATPSYPSQTVPFSTAIPLDTNRLMPDTALSSAMTFSVTGVAVPDAQCKLGLIADGVAGHVPAWSGINVDPAGDPYNNTAGRINNAFVWNDGVRNWVTLRDTGLTAAIPATAVLLSGPSTGTTGVASGAFTVSANGTLSGTVTVTPSDSGAGGTFTPTSVAISSGTPTATFTYTASTNTAASISVTNNGSLGNPLPLTYTSTASGIVRAFASAGETESGNGTSGWTYTATVTDSAWAGNAGFVSDKKIPSGTDGYFDVTMGGWASGVVGIHVALKSAQTLGNAASTYIGLYAPTSNNYTCTVGVNGGVAPAVARAVANQDVMRIGRTGSSVYVAVSSNGGSTFTTLSTFTGQVTTDAYLQVLFGAAGVIASNPHGTGVA